MESVVEGNGVKTKVFSEKRERLATIESLNFSVNRPREAFQDYLSMSLPLMLVSRNWPEDILKYSWRRQVWPICLRSGSFLMEYYLLNADDDMSRLDV